MIHVTLRERREETGLKKFELLNESILVIDILPVPPHAGRGAFISSRVHLDVTYLCQVDEWDTLRNKPDENSSIRWTVMGETDHYVAEEDMKPVYRKLMEKSRSLLLTG